MQRNALAQLVKWKDKRKREYAIKISKNNYGYSPEQKLLTMPFYFTSFLARDIAEGTLPSLKEK